jgi:two-component system chemotaxis response regulator CheY
VRNILVVDDDPSLRDVLAEDLRYRGYTVTVARNGSEALARLDMMTPDVILLDLMMPVMDGWTFVKKYREHAEHGFAPIIAVSADGDLPSGYAAVGVVALLRKPFDLNDLANRIAQLTHARGASAMLISRDVAAQPSVAGGGTH